MELSASQSHHSQLDHALTEIGKSIRILTTLTANAETQEKFLTGWRNNDPHLPDLQTEKPDQHQELQGLADIVFQCDRTNPLGNYVAETAESYIAAIHLIESSGTADFLHYTYQLYGHPQDPFPNQPASIRRVAEQFLELIEPYMLAAQDSPPERLITSYEFAAVIQQIANRKFPNHPIEIALDPNLSSRAAAGATRIRIREQSTFTRHDIAQLVNHELFIHTLTSINGRQQKYFPSLGSGSPRTTQTQEGIAVFSEIATNSMDLMRLRRIALRVIAINMALEGADFLEVFKFFLEAGYDESESSHSTFRIFRGGDPQGNICFTKDIVYLGGFITVQDFLQNAVMNARHDLIETLFSGRLNLTDPENFSEAYAAEVIQSPTYIPDWAEDFSTLATRFISRLPFMANSADTRNFAPNPGLNIG